MAKIWVLDTDTKGTGAQMVPLEKVQTGLAPRPLRPAAPARPRPAKEPEPREPSVFKVVDALSRETLTEGAAAWDTIELLRGVRSVLDVSMFVWEPKTERWRALSLGERKMLWRLRDRRSSTEEHAG